MKVNLKDKDLNNIDITKTSSHQINTTNYLKNEFYRRTYFKLYK